MASVTAVTAAPDTIAAHGGRINLNPVVINPASTFTGIVYDDQGGSRSAAIKLGAEDLTYSVDPAKKGVPGFIVCVLSPDAPAQAAVAVAEDGASFDVITT